MWGGGWNCSMSTHAERRCRANSMTSVTGGEQHCQQPLCWHSHIEGMLVFVAPANLETFIKRILPVSILTKHPNTRWPSNQNSMVKCDLLEANTDLETQGNLGIIFCLFFPYIPYFGYYFSYVFPFRDHSYFTIVEKTVFTFKQVSVQSYVCLLRSKLDWVQWHSLLGKCA